MLTLIALALVCTPLVVTKLLNARHAPAGSRLAHPRMTRAAPPSGLHTDASSTGIPLWTALDDRQLTRLLTDAAPQSSTE